MKAWFKAQSFDVRVTIAVLAIYGLVYLTVAAVEVVLGVAI